MRRSTECKTLNTHLITRTNATGKKAKMNRSRPRAQSHHALILSNKLLQIFLKPIHVRPQRNDPVSVKSLFNVLLLQPCLAHVSQAQVNSLTFRHNLYSFNLLLHSFGAKFYFEDLGLRNCHFGFSMQNDTHKLIENVIFPYLTQHRYEVFTG